MINESDIVALKQQLEAEYKKKIDAYEIVLADLQARKTSNVIAPLQPAQVPLIEPLAPQVGGRQPKRVRGVLAAIRKVVTDMPPPFNREEVLVAIGKHKPDLAANTNLSIVTQSLRTLVNEGVLEIVEPGRGLRQGTYRQSVKGVVM